MYWINFVGPKTKKWAFIVISVQIQYIFLRFGEFNGWKQEPEVRNEHEIDVFSFLRSQFRSIHRLNFKSISSQLGTQNEARASGKRYFLAILTETLTGSQESLKISRLFPVKI